MYLGGYLETWVYDEEGQQVGTDVQLLIAYSEGYGHQVVSLTLLETASSIQDGDGKR